jgi:hypothetical protein
VNKLASLGRSGLVALTILGGVTAIAGTGVFAARGTDDGPLHDIDDGLRPCCA